jgi:hypothetical protein
VNGQPLVNEYVYFPEGYDFLGVPVPKSWLPGAKYGNGKVMT